jgi:hypothetical protein
MEKAVTHHGMLLYACTSKAPSCMPTSWIHLLFKITQEIVSGMDFAKQ